MNVAQGVTSVIIQGLSGTNTGALLNLTNLIDASAVNATIGDNNQITSYAGTIVGLGSITKTGSGSLTLSGTSTFAGSVIINTGSLRILNGAALGSTSGGTTIATGAALELQGGISVNESLTINGSGYLSGGALRSISGNNTYGGNITLTTDGRINNDANTLTINGGISASTKSLTVGGAGDIVVNGVISLSAGALIKDGAGVLTLNNANTYSNTSLSGGMVSLNASNAIPTAAGTITFAGGMLQFTSSNVFDYSPRFATTDNQSFKFDTNGQTVTFGSSIQSTGGVLAKYGTGTLILSGANTYSGATTVNTGSLRAANNSALGTTAGGVTVSSGAAQIGRAHV